MALNPESVRLLLEGMLHKFPRAKDIRGAISELETLEQEHYQLTGDSTVLRRLMLMYEKGKREEVLEELERYIEEERRIGRGEI